MLSSKSGESRPSALYGHQGLLTVGDLPFIKFTLYDWIGLGLFDVCP